MSFNIPNTFLAGTKAIASEVNENFNVIKDEINIQKDNFINLKESFETVSDYVNGNLREELINLIKACHALFCVNSGHTNINGEADLLAIDTVNDNRIVFKVSDGVDGALEPIIFSNAAGERATRTQLTAIDMADSADGKYIICVKTVGSPYATKGKLYKCKKEPSLTSGDIWLDTSKIPLQAWFHNGTSKSEFDDVPIGTATVAGGNLKSVTTFPFNQNGYDINTSSELTQEENIAKSILHISKPDYNSAVKKEMNTSYTANKDGFIYLQTNLGGQQQARLYIGSLTFCYTTTNSYDAQAFIYPIAKGTTYKATGYAAIYFLSHVS